MVTFRHKLCLMIEVPESGDEEATDSSGPGVWHRTGSGTALPCSCHLKQVLSFEIPSLNPFSFNSKFQGVQLIVPSLSLRSGKMSFGGQVPQDSIFCINNSQLADQNLSRRSKIDFRSLSSVGRLEIIKCWETGNNPNRLELHSFGCKYSFFPISWCGCPHLHGEEPLSAQGRCTAFHGDTLSPAGLARRALQGSAPSLWRVSAAGRGCRCSHPPPHTLCWPWLVLLHSSRQRTGNFLWFPPHPTQRMC